MHTFVLKVDAMEEDSPDLLPPYLFFSAENTDDIEARQAPTIVRSRFVKIDSSLLLNPKENFIAEPGDEIRLILNIFKSIEFSVLIYKIKKNRSGSYSWYGKLKNVPFGTVTLVVKDGEVYGMVSKPNFTYQIRHIADGIHVVYEIDPSKFPPLSEPLVPNLTPSPSSLPDEDKMTKIEEATTSSFLTKDKDLPPDSSKIGFGYDAQGALYMGNATGGSEPLNGTTSGSDTLSAPIPSGSSNVVQFNSIAASDDGSVVDVLVVYTPEALAAVGGNSSVMDSLIEVEESATNEAYANSGIAHIINVVHKQQITYSEAGCAFSFSCILAAAKDGGIPGLHELREQHAADLVHVIIKGDGKFCGLAYLMATVSNAFETAAFGTTASNCFSNYTFAHEIGHNMGAQHDRDEALVGPEGQPFTYNFGYVDNTRKFYTIMAYRSSCSGSCTGIQYFSNPDVTFNGGATGIAEGQPRAADNRKTHNNTALTASNFRISIQNQVRASIDERNAHRVIVPYWQSDGSSYSFIAATHPSLDGLAPQIGVEVKAITNRGILFGSAKTFTIDQGVTKRIFITRRGHPSLNSNNSNLTGVELITGAANYQHGFVHIAPVASNPEISVEGFRDVTMLSFWGAVVIESNTTGFAMEFIGDMQDSAATPSMDNIAGVSGVN